MGELIVTVFITGVRGRGGGGICEGMEVFDDLLFNLVCEEFVSTCYQS